MSRKRAIIAGFFAILYPGLGHVYLREWLRAAAWFGAGLFIAILVIPESLVNAFDAGGLAGFYQASQELPLESLLPILAVRLANVLDAVWVALRSTPTTAETDTEATPSCPDCGGDLDDELEFCPWCSTRLQ